MAYTIDPTRGDIVIGGFTNGIGKDPYSGLTDERNVNITPIANEASVNFSTQSVSQSYSTSAVLTADGSGNVNYSNSGFTVQFLEQNSSFTVGTSTISGLTAGTTVYYVRSATNEGGGVEKFSIAAAYGTTVLLVLGNTGTANISTVDMGTPKFFETEAYGVPGSNFMLDSKGRVWSDYLLTSGGTNFTGTNSWTYTGNALFSDSNGNGLVYWRTSNSTSVGDWDGWLFVFRDGEIDYSNVNGVNNGVAYSNVGTYTYGWNPITGNNGNSAYLQGRNIQACPHYAIVGPDGNVYFVDYYTTWKIQQKDIVTPQTFTPTDLTSFITTQSHNMPIYEIGTCIAPLGNNFLIGGRYNKAYVWNGVDQLTNTSTILLAEPYVYNIVTVNTNAYIFCGNRGNIYITNGSQATPWAKIPDHISGTVEPFFAWGGATYQKNQLYFSAYAQDNDGTAITGYGGLWAIDLSTGAIRLANKLSYGTYGGYATAMMSLPPQPVFTSIPIEPQGAGLFIGWISSIGSIGGIDKTIALPYSNGESVIVSDMIPIGTLLVPTTLTQVEYKLSRPLLTGESVQLLVGSSLADYVNNTFTSAGTTTGNGTQLSDNFPAPIQAGQWLLVKAVLTNSGTSVTPTSNSLNRLTQLRVIGATIRDNVSNAPFGLQ